MKNIIFALAALLLTMAIACKKNDKGPKITETGKVYFPAADSINGKAINAITNNLAVYNSANNSVDVAVPVYRGGFTDSGSFTVNVSADTSAIQGLIQSGALPANTVALQPSDYTLSSTSNITYTNCMMQGKITPQIKVSSLQQYVGKNIALGLTLTGTSKFTINDDMSKVVFCLSVDALAGSVYFTEALQNSNALDSVLGSSYVYDKNANTVAFPVAIGKDGIIPNSTPFTVQVAADNSAIQGLINSGALPANTIALPATAYSLPAAVDMTSQNSVMSGNAMPTINLQQLEQYIDMGQTVALGLTITSTSQYGIKTTASNVVIYFNVDDLILLVNPALLNILKGGQMEAGDDQYWKTFSRGGYPGYDPNANIGIWTFAVGGYTLNGPNASTTPRSSGIYQSVNLIGGKTYKLSITYTSTPATVTAGTYGQMFLTTVEPKNGYDVIGGSNAANVNGTANTGNVEISGGGFINGAGGPYTGITKTYTYTPAASGTYYFVIKGANNGGNMTALTISNVSMY